MIMYQGATLIAWICYHAICTCDMTYQGVPNGGRAARGALRCVRWLNCGVDQRLRQYREMACNSRNAHITPWPSAKHLRLHRSPATV